MSFQKTFPKIRKIATQATSEIYNSCFTKQKNQIVENSLKEIDFILSRNKESIGVSIDLTKTYKSQIVPDFTLFLKKFNERIPNLVETIIRGRRPQYWPGWAEKKEFTSIAVDDYEIKKFVKTSLIKLFNSYSNIFKLMYESNQPVEVLESFKVVTLLGTTTIDNMFITDNGEMDVAARYFKFTNTNNHYICTLNTMLSQIMCITDFSINKNTGNISFGNINIDTFDIIRENARDAIILKNILEKFVLPRFKNKHFSVYNIRLFELLLLIMYLKSNGEISLNRSQNFFNNFYSSFILFLREQNLYISELFNNDTLLIIMPNTSIGLKALNLYSYRRLRRERCNPKFKKEVLDINELKKMSNKEFFDCDNFVKSNIEESVRFNTILKELKFV